jgi:predicted NUDIX family phosphoesterase
MTDPQSESVLCLPSSLLDACGRFQGYTSDHELIKKIILSDKSQDQFSFQPRFKVEDDSSYKQLITYSIIQYGNLKNDALLFSYTRGKAGGEDRLKRKLSLGIGGHISEDSLKPRRGEFLQHTGNPWMVRFKSEAQREIDEEVRYGSKVPHLYFTGLINDDSDPVGQVHLGLVYIMTCNYPDVEPLDPAIKDGSMITLSQVNKQKDDYESWSKIVIDSIFEITQQRRQN